MLYGAGFPYAVRSAVARRFPGRGSGRSEREQEHAVSSANFHPAPRPGEGTSSQAVKRRDPGGPTIPLRVPAAPREARR
ncbi:MAG TPA: hypothetical protein VN033_00915, partial [Vulgatibacter sp.]|nr:hypothetical protein [Vulgatibacter sp.]